MDATEGAQVGPAPGARPLTGVTVHLTPAIAIILPRPFVHAVTDGRMTRMAAPIALPLVGVQLGAAGRHVVGNEATACPRVGVITAPKRCSPVSRDTTLMMGGRSLAYVPWPLR